jgi:hypothetical protein
LVKRFSLRQSEGLIQSDYLGKLQPLLHAVVLVQAGKARVLKITRQNNAISLQKHSGCAKIQKYETVLLKKKNKGYFCKEFKN